MYYNQEEYEAVIDLFHSAEEYCYFLYQMDAENAFVTDMYWSYDMDTGYFTEEYSGFVCKTWQDFYDYRGTHTWGQGVESIKSLIHDLDKGVSVWMYRLDGSGYLGQCAPPFSGGGSAFDTSQYADHGSSEAFAANLLPALFVMAGIVLAAILFVFVEKCRSHNTF